MRLKLKKEHIKNFAEISIAFYDPQNGWEENWFDKAWNNWVEYLSNINIEKVEITTNTSSSNTTNKYPKDRDTSKDESIPISQRMFTHPEGHLIGYTRAKMLKLI